MGHRPSVIRDKVRVQSGREGKWVEEGGFVYDDEEVLKKMKEEEG